MHRSPLRTKRRRKKTTPRNGLMLVYNRTQRYGYGVTVGKPETGGRRKIHSHSLPASTTNQYSLWQIWLWFHRPPLFRCVCISFHLILILFFFFLFVRLLLLLFWGWRVLPHHFLYSNRRALALYRSASSQIECKCCVVAAIIVISVVWRECGARFSSSIAESFLVLFSRYGFILKATIYN